MKSFVNNVHVEGYVFSHNLQERVTSENSKNPGQQYISGEIQVATDDQAMNIVPVRFNFVTPVFKKSGKENATYGILKQIIETGVTFEDSGVHANKVRIDGQVEVNDFYTRDGELASPKRVSGSFCHFMTTPIADKPATFELDMLIDAAILHEVEDSDDYMELKGNAFNFRNDLLPLSVSIRNPEGMQFFESQEISQTNPCLVNVWGNITSNVIVRETSNEETVAFGAPKINVTTRTIRSWDVEGANMPMEFDDESTITRNELAEAVNRRQEYLVEVKQRQDARNQSQGGQSGFPAAKVEKTMPTASMNDFPF